MAPIKNVLMINHMFPPFNGVGVIRVSKFVRYLPQYGWKPIVLTCKRANQNQDALDFDMLSDMPKDLEVHRVICPSLYELYLWCGGKAKQGSFSLSNNKSYDFIKGLSIPDPYVGWFFTSIYRAQRLFKEKKIDAVFTSSPRETAHLIGRFLKRKYGIPWIADFRDPWLTKQMRPKRFGVLDKLERHFQHSVVCEADRLLVAWPGIAKEFQPINVDGKVELLTNGFDEQDFQDLQPISFTRFTIVYAGALFKELSPGPFMEALKIIKKNNASVIKKIQVVFLGRQDAYVRELIVKYDLGEVIQLQHQMPHRVCLEYLLGADLLLIFGPDKYWIPSKLYEYLRAGSPILAVMNEESDAVQCIKSTSVTHWVSRCPPKIADIIVKRVTQRETIGVSAPNIPAESREIRCFNRIHLTQRLATVLNAVI